MKKLLQINPVLRTSTSTGRIMQEIGDLAMANGWESYVAYSRGRDGIRPCTSHLLPVGNKASVAWHGLMTRLFDRHGLSSAHATQTFLRQVDALQPDVIHIHNLHGYFLHYPLLFRYLSSHNIPVIWTVHDCWLYTGHCYHYSFAGCQRWQSGCGDCPQRRDFPASWLVDRSRRNYIDKENAFTSLPKGLLTLVPVSEWMAGEMNRSFLSGCDIRVIHNGIDTDFFHPAESDFRKKHNLEEKYVILAPANKWFLDVNRETFDYFASHLTDDMRMVFIGNGVDESRLTDKMINLGFVSSRAEIRAIYAACDVMANCTREESLSLLNVEVQACGTPVVTYSNTGVKETVDGKCGFAVENGNPEEMWKHVYRILIKGKAHFSADCIDWVKQEFDKEDNYNKYIMLYKSINNG